MAVVGTSTVAEIANATLLRFDNDVSLLGGDLVAEFPDSANSGAPHFHFPLPHSFPHTRMKSPCGAGWSIRDSRFFDAYQVRSPKLTVGCSHSSLHTNNLPCCWSSGCLCRAVRVRL
eukprot:COSAG03_NODE_251_length_9941_cov_18.085145_6_plen_117_part_00